MGVSRTQVHGDAISMENSSELFTTFVRFYQHQQQQEQLLLQKQQQQQQQQQIMQQPQKPQSNKIKSFTRMLNLPVVLLSINSFRTHIFLFLCCLIRFFGDKSVQIKVH